MAERAELLMLEDVMALPVDADEYAPVWIEYRIRDGEVFTTKICASVICVVKKGLWRVFEAAWDDWECWRAEKYNVSWRLWSSLPTDEQREAQPWEA